MSSGGGTGYQYPWTSDFIVGVPGANGTLTRYLMPAGGYVSASVSSVSDNSASTTPSIGSASGAGQQINISYTIPNANGTSNVTINGSAVAATAATAATTLATAATTLATLETAATTQATAATTARTKPTLATTQATAATTAATDATAATTLATAATTKPTNATDPTWPTLQPTAATTEPGPTWYYYNVEDCEGGQWVARASYITPRFTYHHAAIVMEDIGPGPYMVVGTTSAQEDQLILSGSTNDECGGGGGRPGPGGME